MARYVDIECDAVTEAIGRKAFRNRSDIQDFLDNIPTADVFPVVRCGKCKYGNKHTDCHGRKYYGCDINIDIGEVREVEPTHYCGYGERRCEE